MKKYLVFNGDADGICAAHQFFLKFPSDYETITGVKRDISLLEKIQDVRESEIFVFDIGVEKNLPYLENLFKQECRIVWFDHHVSHDLPSHRHIEYNIQTDADINTSWIVAQYLNQPCSRWSIVGLFGDNMQARAKETADSIGLDAYQRKTLQKMGELLNYNAYGSCLDDLHFHPAEILETLKPYVDPFEFLQNQPIIDGLEQGYNDDFSRVEGVDWLTPNIVRLPDAKWARRIIGEFAYQLVRDEPQKNFAVLLTNGENYQVSIRISADSEKSAGEFCLQFPSGGGRVKAAGINRLPQNQLDAFIKEFDSYFL